MGKLFMFITMLVFIDLLFLVTGQLTGSLTSILFTAIIDISVIRTSNFWVSLAGAGGLTALLSISAITVGFIVTKSDMVLFIPIAITLSVLAADFIVVFNLLKIHSVILATFVMAPIVILYILTILEWLRGKD